MTILITHPETIVMWHEYLKSACRAALNSFPLQIRREVVVNGYRIKYSDFWSAWQVDHTTSDEVGQADFKKFSDAVSYAQAG